LFAQGIFADESGADQRERRARFGQVNKDIVRRSARALGLAADIAELFGLRIDINQFDLVNDPIATGQQPVVRIRPMVLHGGKTAV